jgi:formate hydrogenlyase subunit 3/multisubunit Na+/H+ antiporter MnhD subunit
MSAPLIWILFPFLAAVLFWLLPRRSLAVQISAVILSLFLTLLAALLPLGQILRVGSFALKIEPLLAIAGRSFILDNSSRPFLVLFYGILAFWLIGLRPARGHRLLAPFAIGMVSLLVAALAARPVLYAALLLEGAILFSLPMLVPPGKAAGQGVLRYLVFQTLAMPLFVLGAWALAGVEANPTDANLILLAGVFLGLGFAFWLAVFPFYTWTPQLSEQVQPYAAGFILLILPTAVLLLMLAILGNNGWLRTSPALYDVLRLCGGVMVLTAGLWAAFQRDLGRLFGYTAIIQTGFSLLALSLGSRLGNEIFVMLFLPRIVSIGLWTLSVSIYRQSAQSLHFSDLERIAEQYPVASAGVAMAFLSLAGLPLLAEFPLRQVLLQEISVTHPIAALGALLGSVGLLFSAFRFLAVITGGNISSRLLHWRDLRETRVQAFLVTSGIVILLVVGLFPRLFFPLMSGLLQVFPNTP